MMRKDKKWNWGERQQKAFEELKKRFTMEPVLVTPDLDRGMRVEADASDFATGGVLLMKCEDERWRPVAYISKSLNEAERNYEIHDKEMLAIIRCLEAWRYFLEGAKGQFEIWTDHKNLEYFMKAQKLNRRQARWSLYLSRFDFALKHVAGKSMGRADSLSRRVDWAEGVEKDNENRVMLKEEWLEVRAMEQLIEEPEEEIVKRIKEARDKDEEVIKIVEEMKKAGVKTLRDEEWQIEEGLVLKEGRVYVLKDERLRVEIIRLHHDTPIAGHGGQWKMVELVTRNYWWPGITKEIKRYVEGCDQCQRMKNRVEMPAGKLRPNQIPEKPWQYISVDFITKLSVSKGHDSILVVCDRFLKMSHFVVTTEKTTAEGLARIFRDNMWKLHGLLESVISDRGLQFAAGMMKELNKMLGIETKLSIAYHPETDGQTERTNQELEQYLRMYVNHRQNNWAEWLVTAEFAFNNKIHTATKMSLFQANYGREPRMGFDIRKKGKNEKAEEFVKEMKERHEEAKAALVKSQEEMKRQVDRNRKEAEEYRVGDKVLISTKDFSKELMKRVTKKLMEKFIGPYVVRKIVSENAVELELPALLRVHLVVNVRRLVKYREQVEGQKKIPPPPVEIAGEKEYEVEEILDRQERRGKTKYLVKWKGYTAEENTWEGLENLKNAMKKVEEFEKGRFEEEIQRIRMKKGKEMKLNPEAEEFKRGELPGRYTVKLLYGWDNKKFDKEYLKKLERNWNRWKNDRKEGEKKYIKKLEKGLEWNEKDEQRSKRIWGDKKEVPLEAEP